ncbi:MAG: cyclase family protein [Microbacterium sp.]
MDQRGENWGRWGTDDERGAANLLTPEVVKAAVGAVRSGQVLSLAMPIKGATSNSARGRIPHLPGRPLPQHFMSVDGGDYAAGARTMAGDIAVADDAIILSPHGTTTHIDALSHMWRDGLLYNGHAADKVRSYGALQCGIDKLGAIVTRGVLLDVASHLGVPHLEPETRIDADLLQACATASGVEITAGDVVLIRTGWPAVWQSDRTKYQGAQPGLAYDGGLWLVEQDVVAIGADNASVGAMVLDATTPEGPDKDIHMLTLWRHGVYLIELLWLDELAATGRSDFLFMTAPLAIDGGTASPITPLAVL